MRSARNIARPRTAARRRTRSAGPHGTAVPQPADSWLLVGQVPAVVSQAHFDEVQAKLATNRSFARRNNTAHPLPVACAGELRLLRPGLHGARVNGRNLYYPCSGKGHSTYSHHATCCPARHTPASQLDALVWKDLCTLLAEPEPLAAAVARAHGGAWLPQELLARRETLRRAQAHLCTSNSSGSPTPTFGRSSRSTSTSGGAATWSSACGPGRPRGAAARRCGAPAAAGRRGGITGGFPRAGAAWPGRRPASSSADNSSCCSSIG